MTNPTTALPIAESQALFERALKVIPGGVHSPVRAFKHVGGTPLFLVKGQGCTVWSADAASYTDYCGSWGPLILGYAHPAVVEAVMGAARSGLTFGTPTPVDVELAELVVSAFPSMEQVRFVSSGTEAVMTAIRLARGATGRDKVLKFAGCYHGHVDHLLVQAGSGVVTQGLPGSAGVPAGFTAETLVAPLNDREALDSLFAAHGESLAAAIIEPLPANNGLILLDPEFLQQLRDLCTRHGALLVLDEVVSGFRLEFGGISNHIAADLTTLGKIVGGGMPVGALLGRRELMEHLAPLGPVYQAGTLSGNPVAMAAGLATLHQLQDPAVYGHLEALGARLEEGMQAGIRGKGWPLTFFRRGSIFWGYGRPSASIRQASDLDATAMQDYAKLHRHLL
ncbi:MAG TPA: glutamate-1-semialdehyde 2,1-aminomutase, partial [bacterium]|nr:glutamate-1-semialdehyde 2,1-aminomutase [bacterium]